MLQQDEQQPPQKQQAPEKERSSPSSTSIQKELDNNPRASDYPSHESIDEPMVVRVSNQNRRVKGVKQKQVLGRIYPPGSFISAPLSGNSLLRKSEPVDLESLFVTEARGKNKSGLQENSFGPASDYKPSPVYPLFQERLEQKLKQKGIVWDELTEPQQKELIIDTAFEIFLEKFRNTKAYKAIRNNVFYDGNRVELFCGLIAKYFFQSLIPQDDLQRVKEYDKCYSALVKAGEAFFFAAAENINNPVGSSAEKAALIKLLEIAKHLKNNFPDFDFGGLDCRLWSDIFWGNPPAQERFNTHKTEMAHIVDFGICYIKQHKILVYSISIELHSLQTLLGSLSCLKNLDDLEEAYKVYLRSATLAKNIYRRGFLYDDDDFADRFLYDDDDFADQGRENDLRSEYEMMTDESLKNLLNSKQVSIWVDQYTNEILQETVGLPTILDAEQAIEKFKTQYYPKIKKMQEEITYRHYTEPLERVSDKTIDLETRRMVFNLIVNSEFNLRFREIMEAFSKGLKENINNYIIQAQINDVSSSFRLTESQNNCYTLLRQRVIEGLSREDEILDKNQTKTKFRNYERITRLDLKQEKERLDFDVINARKKAKNLQKIAEAENQRAEEAEHDVKKYSSELEEIKSAKDRTPKSEKILESILATAEQRASDARTKAEEARKRAAEAKEDLKEKQLRVKAFQNDFSDE